MEDDGHAVHYSELARGTPVIAADGVQVGTVDRVLDNYKERIFDGLVVRSPSGERRFVDAPEVERTAERAVTLTITGEEVARIPLERSGLPGFLRRAFGGR